MRRVLLLCLLASAPPLLAQAVVNPGMPKAKVIAVLGKPAIERTAGDISYLFYPNGCEKRCGMNDLVVLKTDTVVDAVFRSGKRRFSGTSSSPRAIPAAEARKAKATAPKGDADAPLVLPISIKAVKKAPAS